MARVIQVLVVHGGHSFAHREAYLEHLRTRSVRLESFRDTFDWKAGLAKRLGPSYDVLTPRMPCSENARYDEWSLWFQRILEHLGDDLVLVGHSLGGLFLAKYLAEHDVERTVRGLFLVASPWVVTGETHELQSFALPNDISRIEEQTSNVFVYHSKDDPAVPLGDANNYCMALPRAEPRIFANKGHFNDETLPELEQDILGL